MQKLVFTVQHSKTMYSLILYIYIYKIYIIFYIIAQCYTMFTFPFWTVFHKGMIVSSAALSSSSCSRCILASTDYRPLKHFLDITVIQVCPGKTGLSPLIICSQFFRTLFFSFSFLSELVLSYSFHLCSHLIVGQWEFEGTVGWKTKWHAVRVGLLHAILFI